MHDVLDNGICVDCQPVTRSHVLVDGECVSCRSVEASRGHFDPSLHPHDPHSGEFAGTGALKDALKLAGKIDLGQGEHLVASNQLKTRDGNIFMAATQVGGERHLRFGLPEFDESSGEALPWRPNGPYTAHLDQRGAETLRQGLGELDQMGRERVAKARAIADRMDAAPHGSPAYKAAQHDWFQIAGDGQLVGEGSAHGQNGTAVVYKMTMDQEPSVQIAVRPSGTPGWDFDQAVQNGDGGLDLSLDEFRRLRKQLDATITGPAARSTASRSSGVHVLEDGICITCQPVRTVARFDPLEPREPHSGKWVKTPGGGSHHDVAKKLLQAIDDGDNEQTLSLGEQLDKPTFDALPEEHQKHILGEFKGRVLDKSASKEDRIQAIKILDKLRRGDRKNEPKVQPKADEPKAEPPAGPKLEPKLEPKVEPPVKKAVKKAEPKIPAPKAVPKAVEKAPPAKQAAPKAEANPFHGELHGDLAGLAGTVQHGKVRHEEKLSGGLMGDTRKRVYDDGTETVWKRSGNLLGITATHQADAEQVGALVARSLGLRAPSVYRENDNTISMRFVKDATVDKDLPEILRGQENTDEGRMMGMLDLLMNNTDRNRGNWMHTDGEHHLVPIDHGYAFMYLDSSEPGSPSRLMRSDFTEAYFRAFSESFVDHDLTPGDMAEARRRLVKLEPELQRLGRQDWFDFMLARLDAMTPHAKGTKPRLLPAIS